MGQRRRRSALAFARAVWLKLEPKWLQKHYAAPAVVVAAAVALPLFFSNVGDPNHVYCTRKNGPWVRGVVVVDWAVVAVNVLGCSCASGSWLWFRLWLPW